MPRLRWLLRLPEIVLVGLLLIMSTVVFMQVVFRYFLHFPLAWSEELARFLFVWVSLLGAAIGVKQRAHFGFGLLLHALPAGARRAALVAIDVAMLWFAYLLTATGLSGLQTALIQRSPVLNVSLAWVY